MKYIIIITMVLWGIISYSQNCFTEEYFYPVVTPVTNDIAVSTMGWTKNNSLSIEFNGSLNNGWYIDDDYNHNNANNYFSDDSKYWDISGGVLTLKLYDDANGVYEYTAAILCNDDIDQRYGYFEVRVKLPFDDGLCTSFWGFEGEGIGYREIDLFEYQTFVTIDDVLMANEYHEGTSYGGRIKVNPDIIEDDDTWYVFGYEWLPNEYSLYINNHFIGRFDTDTDCVKEDLQEMSFWRLWIVNWHDSPDPTGNFPKTLTADYIRFYSLDLTNISNDFYDYLSNYDYGVWKTVHLGDTYSSDAKFNDNGKHAIRSTDGFTLGSGFEVALGTEFETIIYKP
jgi:beta-glucanase (GH16 family)